MFWHVNWHVTNQTAKISAQIKDDTLRKKSHANVFNYHETHYTCIGIKRIFKYVNHETFDSFGHKHSWVEAIYTSNTAHAAWRGLNISRNCEIEILKKLWVCKCYLIFCNLICTLESFIVLIWCSKCIYSSRIDNSSDIWCRLILRSQARINRRY